MSSLNPVATRALSISFDGKQVLQNVSFPVTTGEALILLGVTGSGKSVLLKLIAGLHRPDSEEILIERQDIVPLRENQLYPFNGFATKDSSPARLLIPIHHTAPRAI